MLPTDKPMSSQLLDKAGLGRGMSIFIFIFFARATLALPTVFSLDGLLQVESSLMSGCG